jgi:biopolymer transport protein ExbB/TolQ
MVKWIVIGVVVLAVVVLIASAVPILRRLSGLGQAAEKLQRRQAEAMKLQESAAVLERSVQALQQRAEVMQERVASIQAGRGEGRHGAPGR